jgi:hypothetical protein
MTILLKSLAIVQYDPRCVHCFKPMQETNHDPQARRIRRRHRARPIGAHVSRCNQHRFAVGIGRDNRSVIGLPRIDEAVVKCESAANMNPQFQAV